jgi:hypothetical protein
VAGGSIPAPVAKGAVLGMNCSGDSRGPYRLGVTTLAGVRMNRNRASPATRASSLVLRVFGARSTVCCRGPQTRPHGQATNGMSGYRFHVTWLACLGRRSRLSGVGTSFSCPVATS